MFATHSPSPATLPLTDTASAPRYVDEKDSQSVPFHVTHVERFADSKLMRRNNFSFKCHRRDQTPANKDQSLVFAVNDINFHPIHGTFSTCGKICLPDFLQSLLNMHYCRGGWDNQLLGQRLPYTVEEYLTSLTPCLACILTFICTSIRPMPWPCSFIRVQSQRIDLCICYFVRLVKGSFW